MPLPNAGAVGASLISVLADTKNLQACQRPCFRLRSAANICIRSLEFMWLCMGYPLRFPCVLICERVCGVCVCIYIYVNDTCLLALNLTVCYFLGEANNMKCHIILTKLNRNGPWVVPYQNCSNGSDWLDK